MDSKKESNTEKEVLPMVFAPHIRNHVKTILAQTSIGLYNKEVEIKNPRSSVQSYDTKLTNCDKFFMSIPYAGTLIECMVLFQSSGPDCAPDFVFSDSRFYAPIDQIESLVSWDVKKPDGLLCAVKEIMQFYKKKQIQELDKYELMSIEYLSLFQLENFSDEDIDILVPPNPESTITFLIRLHVDFRELFPDLYKDGLHTEPYPLLFVTYPNRESNRSNQRLYLSTYIETLLEMGESFQMPGNTTENYLTRYITALEEKLRIKSELAAGHYGRRKAYFAKFLNHFNKNIFAYDKLFHTSMALDLKDDEFPYSVEINLPGDFPTGTPSLTFQSVYKSFNSEPFSAVVDYYPYSSSWSMEKILEETVEFIEDYHVIFMRDCFSAASVRSDDSDDAETMTGVKPKRFKINEAGPS